jgi:glucan phosphorylase
VLNLGLQGEYADALRALGTTLEEAVDQEHNAALGNGGLGRLVSADCAAPLLKGGGFECRPAM